MRTALDRAPTIPQLAVEMGADLADSAGDRLEPVRMTLSTYSRNPREKHEILRLLEASCQFPDTPAMALHRGRIDLLEAHLARDPGMLSRPMPQAELFPAACGADPHVRASVRKFLSFLDDEAHEYGDATALEYGRAFHNRDFANEHAIAVLERAIAG